MKTGFCGQEQQVLDALRSGKWAGPWGEELRRHAAGCSACSEVVFVAEALRREEELPLDDIRLPSAGFVWWKAQLAARRAAAERAVQPIEFVERAAQVFGAVAVLGLAFLYGPRLLIWFGKAGGLGRAPGRAAVGVEWTRHLAVILPHASGQLPILLLAASAGACIMLMAFAAYAVWREE
ncbi:MAG TPA: hypothetical protein VGW33_01815 [Terriglobia bacterium]|nr:hypothetical protein [Terriglobia bacterium]